MIEAMNEAVVTKIAEFAKANRVSKQKLVELFQSVMVPKVNRKKEKSEATMKKIVEIANENNGKVTIVQLNARGIKSAAYVTQAMVRKNMLVEVTPTKGPGRGRASLTFEVV